ncbi:MAG: hypothetical protein ACR2PL_04645, partial [Dehalococcoidia bacterium]
MNHRAKSYHAGAFLCRTQHGDNLGEHAPLSICLLQRVFAYFRPYWRFALIVLACIGVGAALGLAPALVAKGLIDYLAHPAAGLPPLVLLVGVGIGASLAGGLVGVLQE